MLAVGGHALVAVAVAERWPLSRGSNKSRCMDFPPVQKVAIVKRWPLVEVQPFTILIIIVQNISHQEN